MIALMHSDSDEWRLSGVGMPLKKLAGMWVAALRIH